MSIFNKMLASIGIGSAKVNTILTNERLVAGDQVSGRVVILGGKVEQEIAEIYLSIETSYEKEVNDNKVRVESTIGKYRLTEPLTIGINEEKEVPFSFPLPIDTPVTLGKTKVWVETGLDIKMGMDPQDRDYIDVYPHPLMSKFLNAVTDLGFRLREVECQSAPFHTRGRLPFIQEFEFVPTKGEFRGRLDELEVVFISEDRNQMDVFLQIDRRARNIGSLFSEMLNLDETKLRLTVTNEETSVIRDKIRQVISQYS